MKLINLVRKLQEHLRRSNRMHLCWARDPVQPELIQGLETQTSLHKFVSLAVNTPVRFPCLEWESIGSLWIQKRRRSVDGCCECNWRNKYSWFTYRKHEDKDLMKQKCYEELLNNFMKKTWTGHRIQEQCILFEWAATKLVAYCSTLYYIHDFTYICWFSQSWLQNMGIGKWLGGLTNLESWSSQRKTNFQCNDIVA